MNIIFDIVDYLGLQKPYKIELKSRGNKSATAKYWALYSDKGAGGLHSHWIRVYLRNIGIPGERDLNTIIAHELIHAWQEEKGYTDIHGTSFQMKAAEIAAEFKMPGVYNPETDT
jgi:predicted SprT family Zn-dependent metalloprotease